MWTLFRQCERRVIEVVNAGAGERLAEGDRHAAQGQVAIVDNAAAKATVVVVAKSPGE